MSHPRLRILVIDDDADARYALQAVLELLGYEAFSASNGENGARAALSLEPDIAVIDIGLPGMSGWDVARALHEQRPGMRLIALTGQSSPEARNRSYAAGIEAHLVKPVSIDQLAGALRQESAATTALAR
jgi:CheY-like chemotaxis protein